MTKLLGAVDHLTEVLSISSIGAQARYSMGSLTARSVR
jgi:hypothetical protein